MSRLRAVRKPQPRILDSALWRNLVRAGQFNTRRILKPASVKIGSSLIGVNYSTWSPAMTRQILRGDYEKRERKTISAALAPSDRVLEIGGGVGLIALCAREIVRESRIWVYEANPNLIREMKENFSRNGANIFVGHAAIVPSSSNEEFVKFNISREFWASSLLPISSAEEQITAPALRMNDAIKKHEPNVLIMDVEGAECDLLENCDLSGVDKLIIEFHQRITGRKRANAVIERLIYRGFELDLDHSEREVLLFVRESSALAANNHERPQRGWAGVA